MITSPAASTAEEVSLERAAISRRAKERLDRIDDMRAAHRLAAAGRTQREIADILHVTQPRVHRMLKAAGNRGDVDALTPEEIILRATVSGGSRDELVTTLSTMSYTFSEHAPAPFDGSSPGSWTQVEAAHLGGLLSKDEFDQIRRAVRPDHA